MLEVAGVDIRPQGEFMRANERGDVAYSTSVHIAEAAPTVSQAARTSGASPRRKTR
jgi:hypothetical protein